MLHILTNCKSGCLYISLYSLHIRLNTKLDSAKHNDCKLYTGTVTVSWHCLRQDFFFHFCPSIMHQSPSYHLYLIKHCTMFASKFVDLCLKDVTSVSKMMLWMKSIIIYKTKYVQNAFLIISQPISQSVSIGSHQRLVISQPRRTNSLRNSAKQPFLDWPKCFLFQII